MKRRKDKKEGEEREEEEFEGSRGRGGKKEGEEQKAGEEEGATGGLPAHLWEMLMMLRTVLGPWLEVKDPQVPA